MSRFGWAYVNDVITGSGGSGTPGGSDKSIQFASGSTFSGSTNFTFDYTTNTVRLTGTLHADNLIVSSSTIYKSGSTKFGDDATDTHQFTGSLLLSSSYISQTDYIDFNVSASKPSFNQGRIFYDNSFGDLSYYTPVTDVQINLGQQTVAKVKNMTGATISKGKLVHIVGGTGDNPLINTASWDNDTNSANTLGMVMRDIGNGDFGFIMLNGVITNVNTDPARFTIGQVIYLSSSGDYTQTPPVAPKHTVRLGEVIRAHATVGSIFIKIDNGYELDELHNVLITGSSEGDLLSYNNSTGLWVNSKILTGSYEISGGLTVKGLVSASVGLQTAGTVTAQGIISSSAEIKTNSSITASNNIISTAGFVSASNGLYSGNGLEVTGSTVLKGGLTVTGSTFVQGISSSAVIEASSFKGDGLNIVGVQATNVDGAGDDWAIQFKDGLTGTLTGSSNLSFSGSILSASAISSSTWYGLPTSSVSAGGLNTQVQFNSGSLFSGSSNFTFNYASNNLTVTGNTTFIGDHNRIINGDGTFVIQEPTLSGDLFKVQTDSSTLKDRIFVGSTSSANDTRIVIQGSNDASFESLIPFSGTTGQFTQLSSSITGTVARFTTISGSTITASLGLYSTLTASNVTLNNTITGSIFNSLTNNNFVKYNPSTKVFGPASLIGESSSAGYVVISGSVGLIVTGSVRATGLIIDGTTTLGAGFAAGYGTRSTTFTVDTSSYFVGINTTSGSVTANFLSASSYSAGQMFIFKDIGGFAGTVGKEIFITPSGSQKIDNASGATIASNSGSLTIITDGVSNFYIIGTV